MYLDRLDSYYSIDHNELKQKTKPKKDEFGNLIEKQEIEEKEED